MKRISNSASVKAHWNKQLPEFRSQTNVRDALDSVIFVDYLGEKVTKQEFTFSEKEELVKIVSSGWNSLSSDWEAFDEVKYEYNDDGNLTSEQNITDVQAGYGRRWEFVYDDSGLAILQTTSLFAEGVWSYRERLETKYDDRGNPIEKYGYTYSGGEWKITIKRLETYDDNDFQSSIEIYSWINNDWAGDQKFIYNRNSAGKLTLWASLAWISGSKSWQNEGKIEQDWENENMIRQAQSYWNPTAEAWIGLNDIAINDEVIFVYDEQNRLILETFSLFKDGAWIVRSVNETPHETLESGEVESIQSTYRYSSAEEREHTNTFTRRYNDLGIITYEKESAKVGTTWYHYYERISLFDASGNDIETTSYLFLTDGTRIGDFTSKAEYNSDNQITIRKSYVGKENSDNDWKPVFRDEHEYQNKVASRVYRSVANGDSWIASSGSGVDLDFNIPRSEILMPSQYESKFKVLASYTFTAASGDFDANVFTYYYSPQSTLGVENVEKGAKVSIYPNPTSDYVNIDGQFNSASLIDINGKLILTSSDAKINLSSLCRGIYLLRIATDDGIFSRKIMKQ